MKTLFSLLAIAGFASAAPVPAKYAAKIK